MERNGKKIPGIVVVVTETDGIHVPLDGVGVQGMVTVETTIEGGRVVRALDDEVKRLAPVTSTVLVNVGMSLHEDIMRGKRTP